MRKLLSVLAIVGLFISTGCGPDSELVASGKNHKCKAAELTKKLEADPNNAALKKELLETAEFLKSVIDSAPQGDRAKLAEAIDKAFAEGCK